MTKIDAIRFGLAGGIVAMALIFILTLLATASGFGHGYLNLLKDIFPGYEIGVVGSLVGAGYAFIFGFIKLFALAFIYNMLGPASKDETKY
jgi:hypothetical protein